MKTLDMRGQPCPIPVVHAKKALSEIGGVAVIVDNFVAVQNLEKMAKGTGCGFSFTEDGASQYTVTIVKGASSFDAAKEASTPVAGSAKAGGGTKGPVVLITADSMGRGDCPRWYCGRH